MAVTGTVPHLSSITLPKQLSYKFEYNTPLGELTKITYPTGGYTRYEYSTFTHFLQAGDLADADAATAADYREVTARHECRDPQGACTTATEDTTLYSPTVDGTMVNNQFMDETDPLGNRTRYNFMDVIHSGPGSRVGGTSFAAQELFRYVYQGNSTLIKTVQTDYSGAQSNGLLLPNALPIRITTTLNDTNQVKKVEYDYDTLASGEFTDNIVAEREYDFGPSAPGPLVRRIARVWLKTNSVNNTDYTDPSLHIINRKTSETLYDSLNDTCEGQARACAQTLYEYDNYTAGLSASGATQHAAAYDASAGFTARGNITAVQAYRNTDNIFLTTRNQYDDAGNIVSVTDPANHKSTLSYADSWGNAACAPAGGSSAAYVTSSTNAKTQTSSKTYDSCSGAVASSTDVNGQVTSFVYDEMGRLTQTTLPADDNGSHPQISITFNESSLPLSITTKKTITTSANLASTVTLDGLGRVTKSQLDSDPLGLIVDTTYDGMGRKATESNPHRSATGGATDGTTSFLYDALGRTTQVTHPDGSIVSISYVGSATKVTDEGNGSKRVQRTSQMDGLGRLVSLCEVSSGPFVGGGGAASTSLIGAGGTPADCALSIPSTGFLTTYTYDVLGNLKSASQVGNMQRTFTYDSLSHLMQAVNPESGAISYTYDAAGNVKTKTDARSITTTYAYDELNRLIGKTYATGTTPDPLTPPVTLTYDACPTSGCPSGMSTKFQVGRLVAASNSSATTFESYDALGQVTNEWQCTPVNCGKGTFSLSYSYNLAGNLLSETNGVGVTLTYGYDGTDRLDSATSNLADMNHPANLLSNLQYGPMGITAETLGNGVTEAINYTNRGQLQSLALGGIKVIDNPATPGTASVSIGGSEASVTPPATPAQGSVLIDGTLQSFCQEPSPDGLSCLALGWDSGSVSITVGTFTAQSNFSQLRHNSADSIAADLLSQLNGSGSPVTASLDSAGTTINLKSIATGSGANLTLSTNATSSAGLFSFTAAPSGPNLTGGGGGQLVYDAGSVTINVNGTPYAVPYGQGSTPNSIASAAASALTAGTLVNATATGNVVNIKAKNAGAFTNYSLAVSSSTNNPQGLFSGPSFTASASGSALTNGANASTTTQGATIYSLNMAYAPNGNVTSAQDSVIGNWAYSYDDFNRLTGSNNNNGQQVFSYVYDRFGNRWQQNGPLSVLLTFNLSANNRMDSYSYDAAGNLLSDGTSAFTYDAESRVVQAVVSGGSGGTINYVYDAAGHRVRKTLNGASTDFIYNLGGVAVAEVDGTGAWTRGEVFVGGKHLATYAGGAGGSMYFNHADWLGTERVRSDKTGAACETVNTLIFGDGMTTSGTCGDPSTRHFTGKEHDPQTNLDDFGARYYSSQFGRFVSADWSAVPAPVPYANLANPQTLNLYAIVDDNPGTFADLDGHLASGQLGSADGTTIVPRMRPGDDASACALSGCDSYTWQLTITYKDGSISVEYFASGPLARYAAAQATAQNTTLHKAESALDWFNNVLGLAKSNCAGGGDCLKALGLAGTAIVVAVVSDGASEEAFIEKQIATASTKVENIGTRILTSDTLEAAEREVNGGMKILRESGKAFDHEEKIRQGISGLNKQITRLERILRRSGVSESRATTINNILERARGFLRVATDAITPKEPN